MKQEEELSGQMSFLEHLDELRKRLVWSILVLTLAFIFCWVYREPIYDFLAKPIYRELAEATSTKITVEGLNEDIKIVSLDQLKEGEGGRYIFNETTQIGASYIPSGTSVMAKVDKNSEGKLGLYTDEPILTNNAIIPKGVKLPIDFTSLKTDEQTSNSQLIVTTAVEPFTLYVTVSIYGAIALSVPFLLWQIWGFISPALYAHEKSYVTPFIGLSSVAFVIGAGFAYYILFPPALQYMLWLGKGFRPMLKATDYLDLITLIMLAMGIIFQMPAVSYVLSRIGLITAKLLIQIWKYALIVILFVAAFVSPTGDIPNMLLFASPMVVLYLFSILIAYIFGKERKNEA